MIIPIAAPKKVAQFVPAIGSAGSVGCGVGLAVATCVGPGVALGARVGDGVGLNVTTGVAVTTGHVQSVSLIHVVRLQLPDIAPVAIWQTRSVGHSELLVQLLLHCGTCVGVGLGDEVTTGLLVGVGLGVRVGDGDGVGLELGVGLGDGVGVAQTQVDSATQAVFLQTPVEHVILVGQSLLVVQTLLHCGTGVGVGEGTGLGVLSVNDKLHIAGEVDSLA